MKVIIFKNDHILTYLTENNLILPNEEDLSSCYVDFLIKKQNYLILDITNFEITVSEFDLITDDCFQRESIKDYAYLGLTDLSGTFLGRVNNLYKSYNYWDLISDSNKKIIEEYRRSKSLLS